MILSTKRIHYFSLAICYIRDNIDIEIYREKDVFQCKYTNIFWIANKYSYMTSSSKIPHKLHYDVKIKVKYGYLVYKIVPLNKCITQAIIQPMLFDYSQNDWLIDWCLTPTLPVFQPYCGLIDWMYHTFKYM